jgi:uncharacterized protein YukE
MSNIQQFDYERARALEGELVSEIESINETLNRIQTTRVETVREWWRGGSEEAFIRNFESTKREVSRGLRQWLEEYKKIMRDVSRTKDDQEKALTRALRN